MPYVATVKYSYLKSCYITVPKNYLEADTEVFEISSIDRTKIGYFSCSKGHRDNDTIEINKTYAECLGITESTQVIVEPRKSLVPRCENATLQLSSELDYEIFELNKGVLENSLMNQIQIIWKDQKFPVWLQNTIATLTVISTSPNDLPVKLVEDTLLNISPVIQHQNRVIYTDNEYKDLASRKKKSDNCLYQFNDKYVNKEVKSLNENLSGFFISSLLYNTYTRSLFGKNTALPLQNTIVKYKELIETPMNLPLFRVCPLKNVFFNAVCESHPALSNKLKKRYLPAVVFISINAVPDIKNVPEYFLVKLSKCWSPLERSTSKNKHTDNKIKNRENTVNNMDLNFNSTIVQVIVLNNFEMACTKCIGMELNQVLKSNNIIMPDCLRKSLGLEVTSYVHLQTIHYESSSFDTVHLCPVLPMKISEVNSFKTNFTAWLRSVHTVTSSTLIFCNNTLIQIPTENGVTDCIIKASLSNSSKSTSPVASPVVENNEEIHQPYWFIDPTNLSTINIDVTDFEPVKVNGISLPCQNLCLIDHKSVGVDLSVLGGVRNISEKGLSFLELWLNLSPMSNSIHPEISSGACLLICGPWGAGKSTLSQSLCQMVSKSPYYGYCHVIACENLRGRRAELLWKNWRKECLEVIHRQPSVLLIDNLDLIAAAPTTPEQEISADGMHFYKVANAFLNLITFVRSSKAKVSIIVTAKSVQSLHPILISTRGSHIFNLTLEINCPTKEERKDILRALLHSKHYLSAEMEEDFLSNIAYKTEGCVAEDLNTIVNRATHAAWIRNETGIRNNELKLTESDFNIALRDFTPSSLQGVHLHKSGNKQWSDVGGLANVKKALHEILVWPIKYPSLFSACSLRLQSGILLYGPPGTGKTLLAGVVAKECGLNFINIKGPELLSKYIGASEQALRDVFKNAQSAKPCILFFDEFDALAPRRGHDSTGVTDRVVNQMLTQMDGVEVLNGVYVLAATSRPDLIDPALLRPGRLDKHLHCPLPNEMERLEILEALSRNLTLAKDVDFETLSELTPNFSGADLQALLYSAQIESLHHINQYNVLDKKENKNEELSDNLDVIHIPTIEMGIIITESEQQKKIENEVITIQENVFGRHDYSNSDNNQKKLVTICITQNNLMNVLSKTKPSVSPTERQKYQYIYEVFRTGPAAAADSQSDFGGKRVTLA